MNFGNSQFVLYRYEVVNRFMMLFLCWQSLSFHSLRMHIILARREGCLACLCECVRVCVFCTATTNARVVFSTAYTPYSQPNLKPSACLASVSDLGRVCGMRACVCLIALVFTMYVCVCVCMYASCSVLPTGFHVLIFMAQHYKCAAACLFQFTRSEHIVIVVFVVATRKNIKM